MKHRKLVVSTGNEHKIDEIEKSYRPTYRGLI